MTLREAIRLARIDAPSPMFERSIKWIAIALGFVSALAVAQNWHPLALFASLPFCLIWAYCGWLHTEPQLKWINIFFAALYAYGIARWLAG